MNNYHIYEEVGRGKYSVVYKGRIKKSIKYVAVKSVERSRRRKLMNEVRIVHDLQHKNVLKFHNWYETRNHLWIIFEYCAGGDLYSIIEQDKRLPEETVRKFAFELVEGLSYLHANGILFCDLKPSNVLLNEYGVLKFADFGLSKKLSDFTNGQQQQQEAAQEAGKPKAGTPYYMAPELFHDSGVHSYFSDFWSLGCVLYELAAGKPPFNSNSLKDLIITIVDGDAPLPLPQVTEAGSPVTSGPYSSDFNDLLKRLLEKDPTKRMGWDDVKLHPFWLSSKIPPEFTKRVYPQQTQFDLYLKGRGINPDHFYDQRMNPLVKKLSNASNNSNSQPGKIDILRLSHNVRRNIKREQDEDDSNINGGQYGPSAQALHNQHTGVLAKQGSGIMVAANVQAVHAENDDVSLNGNRRMVLNFGEKEEDESEDASQPMVLVGQPKTALAQTAQETDLKQKQKGLSDGSKALNFYPLPEEANSKGGAMKEDSPNDDFSPSLTPQQQQQPISFDKVTVPSSSTSQVAGMKKPASSLQNVASQGRLQQPPTSNIFTKTTSAQQQAAQTHQIPLMTTSKQSQHPQSQKDLMMLINQQVFTQPTTQLQVIGTISQTMTTSPLSGGSQQTQQNSSPFNSSIKSNSQTTESTQPSTQASTSKTLPVKTIDQLLMHNSDTAVKPIIGNKEIEKTQAANETVHYDENALTFVPWNQDQVVQLIDSVQIEGHLNELFGSIGNATSTLNEKVNALLYFESIVVNSNVSNRLINSVFMNLLVKMLKTVKTPQIRVRVCSAIGLLVRHSTVIENDVAESEVCSQLVDVLMRDKNEKVRRKAVAALGEYMFYAATQLDDDQADPCWEIRDDAINAIIKSLRVDINSNTNETSSDETVIFYAVKTLENITAQSNSAGGRFATVESTNYLLQIFLGIHTPGGQNIPVFVNENLRTSAAVALSHICRLQPKLFPLIFNKITPRLFCYTLAEGQARVQQAFITLLNQALAQNIYPKINEILLRLDGQGAIEEESSSLGGIAQSQGFGFLPCLMKLLEHHSIVIRGKALLTFLLLFKQDFRWMAIVDPEVKFFHVLDRLSRDSYKYVQCCLLCLIEGIVDIIPYIFSAISEELNILLNGGRTASIPSEFDRRINRAEFESLQQGGNMIYIAIVLDILQAQCVKARIVNYGFIRSIATLIDNSYCCSQNQEMFSTSFQGAEEFLNALLLIVESISSSQKILMQMSDAVITVMLPVLLQKTRGSTDSLSSSSGGATADIRFLSLKIFTDIVIQYLNDDSIYDPAKDTVVTYETSDLTAVTTRQLSDLLQAQLFPRLLCLLQDADPVPLFALKLLSAIVERNPPLFARQMRKQDPLLLPLIAENYQVGHPRLNRHTINILKSVIQSKELTLQEIQHFRLGEKTHLLLKSAVASKTQAQPMGDWCTEILLDVLQLLLAGLIDIVKTKENEVARLIDDVLSSFDLCVQLLSVGSGVNQSSSEMSTALVERSSQCLILMLQLYALCQNQQKKREIYFTEGHLGHLINALKAMTGAAPGQSVTGSSEKKIIVKRVLKCIYWALIQSEYQVRLKADKRQFLDQLIQTLLQTSDDRSIQNTSREIYKILREYPPTVLSTQQSSHTSGSQQNLGVGGQAEYSGMMMSMGQTSNVSGGGGYQSNFYK